MRATGQSRFTSAMPAVESSIKAHYSSLAIAALTPPMLLDNPIHMPSNRCFIYLKAMKNKFSGQPEADAYQLVKLAAFAHGHLPTTIGEADG